MSNENVSRDSDGKIISYTKPGCAYGEVLSVKLDGRMERMESNIGDARIEVGTLSEKMEKIVVQMTTVCGETRGLMNEVRIYTNNQKITNIKLEKAICDSEEVQGGRLDDLEKHVTFMRNFGKILAKALIIGVPVAGLVLGLIKLFEGKV